MDEIYRDVPIGDLSIDVHIERSNSPNKDLIGNNNNDISISAINNTTKNDTSMNLTQFDLVSKLEKNDQPRQSSNLDAFDNQSSTSFIINEEDLDKYEESI